MVYIVRIKSIYLTIVVAVVCADADAVRWPVMTDAKITKCIDGTQGPCANGTDYAGSSAVLDIGSPVTQNYSNQRKVIVSGVHCNRGNAQGGVKYSKCQWNVVGTHNPTLVNCEVTPGTWNLTSSSTCATSNTWGPHAGAAAGGECVLFGFKVGINLLTPFGEFSAEQVANGGNRFCIKPLPPSVTCEVSLPPSIDHGTVSPGSFTQKYIDGNVNCGTKPVVTVIGHGGGRIELAPGVVTEVTAAMQTGTQLRVQSNMTVGTSAKPYGYSASIIVAVSPY